MKAFKSIYGGVQAAQYPISIYKPWFRKILIYIIPLATVNYFPAMNILGKVDQLNYPSWMGGITNIWVCIFHIFIADMGIWSKTLYFHRKLI